MSKEKLKFKNKLLQNQLDRYIPCADCRDKVKEGICLRCENQTLEKGNTALKQALEKAEDVLDNLKCHAKANEWELYDENGNEYDVEKYIKEALSEIQRIKEGE